MCILNSFLVSASTDLEYGGLVYSARSFFWGDWGGGGDGDIADHLEYWTQQLYEHGGSTCTLQTQNHASWTSGYPYDSQIRTSWVRTLNRSGAVLNPWVPFTKWMITQIFGYKQCAQVAR